MNASQTKLLRWLDSQWTRHQRAVGAACDREARLAMYRRATGRAVSSSKHLRNDDITAVKRHVLALVQPDNFSAQFRSQVDNDPAATRQRYFDRINSALLELKPDSDFAAPRFAGANRATYINALARKMYDSGLAELSTDDLRKFAGLIETRAAARVKRDQAAALRHAVAAGEASDDGTPF